MILPPLTRHLAVCSLADVPRFLSMDRDFWHVISIRESSRPKLELIGSRTMLPFYFDDLQLVEPGSKGALIQAAQAQDIWRFVDATAEQPLLIHCLAGLSRSTAVAAAIFVRALNQSGTQQADLAAEAVKRLLAIRPQACPNGPILLRLLEQLFPVDLASQITSSVVEDARILRNRVVRPR